MIMFFFSSFKKKKREKKKVEDEDAWRIPTMFTLTLVTILCFYFLHPSPVGRTEGLRFHSTWNWMYKKKEREPLRRRFGHDMTWNRFMGLRFTSQVRQLQICVFSLCSDWSIFFCPYGTILRHIFFLALGLSLLYN